MQLIILVTTAFTALFLSSFGYRYTIFKHARHNDERACVSDDPKIAWSLVLFLPP
jgi:hypothetical protein